MVAWGLTRLALMALVTATDLNEAHLQSQMTVAFAALSAAYVVAGVTIWRRV